MAKPRQVVIVSVDDPYIIVLDLFFVTVERKTINGLLASRHVARLSGITGWVRLVVIRIRARISQGNQHANRI